MSNLSSQWGYSLYEVEILGKQQFCDNNPAIHSSILQPFLYSFGVIGKYLQADTVRYEFPWRILNI